MPLNIGGYKYDKKTKTLPVFINYDKSDDIQDTIKYEDHFLSASRLIAISKQGRSLESEDVQNFLNAEQRGIHVELFVRKNKDDKISKEFYYLGRMRATGFAKEFTMSNTNKSAVEIEWELDTPVREDIYAVSYTHLDVYKRQVYSCAGDLKHGLYSAAGAGVGNGLSRDSGNADSQLFCKRPAVVSGGCAQLRWRPAALHAVRVAGQ